MINKDNINLFSLVTILCLSAIYLFVFPSAILAKEVSLEAKLHEIEGNVNVLWKKTHHFERECPSKENATLSKNIINDLEKIKRDSPTYGKMDKILFMLAQAKTMMVDMCNCYSDQSDYCSNRGEKEYLSFFGLNYVGAEYETLIRHYPKSPYLEDAMFYHASDLAGTGECESDMTCHLHRSIDAFSPFIKKYSTSPGVRKAVDDVNGSLRRLTWNPEESGLWEIYDIEEITTLLKNYNSVVARLPEADMRAESFYLLACAFISVGQFEIAEQIYNDLESHYPKYRNARSRAAYLVIDYSEKIPANKKLHAISMTQYTARLSDYSPQKRLEALNRMMSP